MSKIERQPREQSKAEISLLKLNQVTFEQGKGNHNILMKKYAVFPLV